MDTPHYVGIKLKTALTQHGLTPTEFAHQSGVQWAKLLMLLDDKFVSIHIQKKVLATINKLNSSLVAIPASESAVIPDQKTLPLTVLSPKTSGFTDLDKIDLIAAIRNANLPSQRQLDLITKIFPEFSFAA